MNTRKSGSVEPNSKEPSDFSLVLGGPLFQLLLRAHLTGNSLELVARRMIVLSAVTWLPLLILSTVEGNSWGNSVKVPFLLDFDVHARFLLALPLFIAAELLVHQRMRLVVRQFLDRGIVPDEERGKFDAAIASAMRLRNSIVAEVLLIAFVYVVGVMLIWRHHSAMSVPTWYGIAVAGKLHPTVAGWWFGCVSLPMVQFILLRWYFRIFIWTRFLWHVSSIDLKLVPMHPDRAGGLGFLGGIIYAFAPLLAGQGVLLAGVLANKIFFEGAKLTDFKLELVAMVAVVVFVVLVPLMVFAPLLARAKRAGLIDCGALAQRYARKFDEKWLRGGAPPDEPLLGCGDIQFLGNSFDIVKGMKPVPFTKETVLQLVVITLLPVAPLVLTMIPLGELIDRFLKVVF